MQFLHRTFYLFMSYEYEEESLLIFLYLKYLQLKHKHHLIPAYSTYHTIWAKTLCFYFFSYLSWYVWAKFSEMMFHLYKMMLVFFQVFHFQVSSFYISDPKGIIKLQWFIGRGHTRYFRWSCVCEHIKIYLQRLIAVTFYYFSPL